MFSDGIDRSVTDIFMWIYLRLTTGAAVEITGLWKACPPGKEQSHELQTTEVKVVGASDPEVSCGYIYWQFLKETARLMSSSNADISHPEEIPHARFPSPDPTPPAANAVQLPPVAIPIGVHIPAGERIPVASKRGFHTGPAAVDNLVRLRRRRGDLYRHSSPRRRIWC